MTTIVRRPRVLLTVALLTSLLLVGIAVSGCSTGEISLDSGGQNLPCPSTYGPVPWYWLPAPNATKVFVGVINAETSEELYADYYHGSVMPTASLPTHYTAKVWDRNGSTGPQALQMIGNLAISIHPSSGIPAGGRVSWFMIALDDHGNDVGFGCISPSQG